MKEERAVEKDGEGEREADVHQKSKDDDDG